MNRNLAHLLLISALFLTPFVRSAMLVITTDGKSFWVQRTAEQGDLIAYRLLEGGAEQTLPAAQIAFLIPRAEPGGKYPAQVVDRVLEDVEKARRRFPKLARQTVLLSDEWRALKHDLADFPAQIDALVKQFDEAPGDIGSYRQVTGQLQMLRYRDMQGKHWRHIDTELARITETFLKTAMSTFAELARDEYPTIENYMEMRRLGYGMLTVETNVEAQQRITRSLDRQRIRALGSNVRRAVETFGDGKSIDAYLQSARILADLQEKVAESEDSKQQVAQQRRLLLLRAGQARGDVHFQHQGFPLTTADRRVLEHTRPYSSSVEISGLRIEEQCLLFPLEPPEGLRFGHPFTLGLRTIFNRAQPDEREYILVGLLRGEDGLGECVWNCRPFKLEQGHADIVLEGDFANLPEGFRPRREAGGAIAMYLFLAMRDTAAPEAQDGEPGQSWIALSRACRIPLR